jgi:anti-sigma regulatory factor (Ser/Thr protein kinase)
MGDVHKPSGSQSGPTLRLSLDRDPQAPSLARAAVAGFTEQSELDSTQLATLTLLVSELVSNAVVHSDAPPPSDITLCARVLEEGAVRVEVIDQGNGFSTDIRIRARARGGFGLFLVDTQATRWGVDREGGTRVWFELAASPSKAPVESACA